MGVVMNELEQTSDDALVREPSRFAYLIPTQRHEWRALAMTVVAIGLVLAWMWAPLALIMDKWIYVLGFIALVSLRVTGNARRSKKARRHVLKALGKAKKPLSTKALFKRMALRKISPEVVNATLHELLEESLVEADLEGDAITYSLSEPS